MDFEFTRGKQFRVKEAIKPMYGSEEYAVKDGVIPAGWLLRFLGVSDAGDPVFHYEKLDGSITYNTIVLPRQRLGEFIEEMETE